MSDKSGDFKVPAPSPLPATQPLPPWTGLAEHRTFARSAATTNLTWGEAGGAVDSQKMWRRCASVSQNKGKGA